MGTRGFVGFASGDKETIIYNQYDSYPSGLGVDALNFAREVADATAWEDVRGKVERLRHVNYDVPPTAEDIAALAPWTNLSVSERSTSDWYCLTRETQGDAKEILNSGYAFHDGDFPRDSLFCEWGYLFNLDALTLEVYQGFQTAPHKSGRFADREGMSGYYPVKLIHAFDLNNPPRTDADMLWLER